MIPISNRFSLELLSKSWWAKFSSLQKECKPKLGVSTSLSFLQPHKTKSFSRWLWIFKPLNPQTSKLKFSIWELVKSFPTNSCQYPHLSQSFTARYNYGLSCRTKRNRLQIHSFNSDSDSSQMSARRIGGEDLEQNRFLSIFFF